MMSTPDNDPQYSKYESRFNWITLLLQRVAVLVLGLLAFIVAFVCCCTGTGLSILAVNGGPDIAFSIAMFLGAALGLAAFILVVRKLWPKS